MTAEAVPWYQSLVESFQDDLESATSEQAVEEVTTQILTVIRRGKQKFGMVEVKPVPSLREHVIEVDGTYVFRPHLEYLIERLEQAAADVESGMDRWIRISMPPRSGKTELTTIKFPTWLMRKHPDWHYGLMSNSKNLAVSWGRDIRRLVLRHTDWDISIAKDAGAVTSWQTVDGGQVMSRGIGETISGVGFKVLIGDDLVGDASDAASQVKRESLWQKYSTDILGRREPPTLYIMIGTRFHEDDLLGRLQNPLYEKDPDRWEVIVLPAVAEATDVLGRAPGEPLLSPLFEETKEQAIARWAGVEEQVGPYAWASLYQQEPNPADGDIFLGDWWRYWTRYQKNATEDGRVVYLDLETATGGRWLDSWDLAFKGLDTSDYVVGQRWWHNQPHRYLIGQHRKRMDFTQTLDALRAWADPDSLGGTGGRVHERLVEDKANGPAVIRTLREEIPGMVAVPVPAGESKVARARAVTPEIKAGNVFLPFPGDPGNEWVAGLLAELGAFPRGTYDDTVDAMSQALGAMRGGATSWIASGRRELEEAAEAAANVPVPDLDDREALRQAAFREQRKAAGW